jgi:2-haloacid dehalogenase
MPKSRFQAIAFDLLSAHVDSWSLWIDAAGQEELGRKWRSTSLRIVTTTGTYQPYENILRRATAEVGLPPDCADVLLARWGELRPWPEIPTILSRLQAQRLAIVTDCSQKLAELTATGTAWRFEVVMSAERAGAYKTDPRAYLAAATALGLEPQEILFVAGSAHDVPGAGQVGMKVYWSNRQHLPVPDTAPMPLVNAPDLNALPDLL